MALDLSYRPIEADTVTHGFCCGERELDRFFVREAWEKQQLGMILTTCAYLPRIAAPVGFYSITTVAEEVANLPASYHRFGRGEHYPALQLVYLAVHGPHQDRDIGISMAGAVIELFAEVGQMLAIPHLILVPINDGVIPFYRDQLGFTCYRDQSRMYLPLQDAIEAAATPAADATGDLFEGPTA